MAGPPPVVARARLAVRAALTERIGHLADLTNTTNLSPKVLVGLSGGADSLALLVTTSWVAERMGLQTCAVIIDHGLQEGSDQVAQRAADQAERLGARSVLRRAQVDPTSPGGVENAARDARHQLFEEVLEQEQALGLLLGHTLDDQAEQVLMGLARGAGPRALSGIPRRRGALLRPFLGTGRDERTALRRADTEQICRVHELEWWEDPMNTDTTMLRAAVRHRLLPMMREVLGDHIDENLARTADLLAPDAQYLDARAREDLDALLRAPGTLAEDGDLLHLDVHALSVLPAALRTRVVKEASARARQEAGTPSGKSMLRRQLLAVDALAVSWHGQAAVPLPGRIEVIRRDGRLVWRRSSKP